MSRTSVNIVLGLMTALMVTPLAAAGDPIDDWQPCWRVVPPLVLPYVPLEDFGEEYREVSDLYDERRNLRTVCRELIG